MLGQLAYYLKGMEMLPSIKPTSVEIEYDGKFFGGEIMFFLVSLTNSVGGFEKLAPDSSLDDGMFDLIILKKANLAEFIRIATLALRGNTSMILILFIQKRTVLKFIQMIKCS